MANNSETYSLDYKRRLWQIIGKDYVLVKQQEPLFVPNKKEDEN